jgi:hypothetical protein
METSQEKTKERSILRRTLEFVPLLGTALFYSRPEYTKFEYENKPILVLKKIYHSANVVLLGLYLFGEIRTSGWTMKDYKKEFEKENKKIQVTDSTYNSILQENVDDTTFVNLLNKYTPLREKEKVVLQNKLERDLK